MSKFWKLLTGGAVAGLAYSLYNAWRKRQGGLTAASGERPQPHTPQRSEEVGRWEDEGGNVPRANLGTHGHPVRDGTSTSDESPPGTTH